METAIWEELEQRGATMAVGRRRAGRAHGHDHAVALPGRELVDLERRSSRDELWYALEAPVWNRFGSAAGQPFMRGEVVWVGEDRTVVIVGRRGDHPFEEVVS